MIIVADFAATHGCFIDLLIEVMVNAMQCILVVRVSSRGFENIFKYWAIATRMHRLYHKLDKIY